jgi:hypothetical protein
MFKKLDTRIITGHFEFRNRLIMYEKGGSEMSIIRGIEKTMREQGLGDETRFDFTESQEDQPERIIALIRQMDQALSEEQRLSIMEQQGCSKDDKTVAPHRTFARKHRRKAIEEKVRLYTKKLKSPHKPKLQLNNDGTLSAYWGFGDAGKFHCVCPIMGEASNHEHVPLTFCGCCGGHTKFLLQCALGVELKLMKIVSSAASSGGGQRCEFLFEIVKE